MTSAIFYELAETPLPIDLPVPAEFELGVIEYAWTERIKATPKRLGREHARYRQLATRLCIVVSAASILLGAAVWPPHEQHATTKRVTMNECNGLLTIYGTRCN